MGSTKIEWARNPDGSKGKTWNPITGCSPISPGCDHCYAASVAKRFWKGRKFSDIGFMSDKILSQPLHWKKPQRVFVGSMTDIFHQDIPTWWLDKIFGIMAQANWHTFLILTKRPERMKQYIESCQLGADAIGGRFPWKHIWLGVTAENQEQADKRIPILLQIPAAVRFVSVEPMLGPVDLTEIKVPSEYDRLNISGFSPSRFNSLTEQYDDVHYHQPPAALDWVICGGESGPGARPVHPDWVRDLRDQCVAAGTPFLFKQWGEWQDGSDPDGKYSVVLNNGNHYLNTRLATQEERANWHKLKPTAMAKVGKKKSGRLLDGVIWDQYPEV